MNILILGDVLGIPGVEAIKKNLPKIIKEKKIDFVIANGENAADNGLGITKKTEDFFSIRNRCYYNRKSCLGSKRNT